MTLNDGLLLYLSILATAGLIAKLYQLAKHL